MVRQVSSVTSASMSQNHTMEAEALLLFEATASCLKLDRSVARGSEPTDVKLHICTMPC